MRKVCRRGESSTFCFAVKSGNQSDRAAWAGSRGDMLGGQKLVRGYTDRKEENNKNAYGV